MTGKQHLVSGGALGTLTYTAVKCLEASEAARPFVDASIGRFFSNGPVETTVFPLMFLVGCLLPDIDQEGSLLGRFFSVGGEHRTWTHSVYPLLVLFGLAFWKHFFFFLMLGALCHLLMDSFSKCGVCWFKCFSGYRRYPGGAKIKKGRHLALYTNNVQAWIVCTVLVMTALFVLILARGVVFGPLVDAVSLFWSKIRNGLGTFF